MQRNFIRSNGAYAIADALKVNRALTKISNSYRDIDNNSIGNIGTNKIAEALALNTTITTLSNCISEVCIVMHSGIKE